MLLSILGFRFHSSCNFYEVMGGWRGVVFELQEIWNKPYALRLSNSGTRRTNRPSGFWSATVCSGWSSSIPCWEFKAMKENWNCSDPLCFYYCFNFSADLYISFLSLYSSYKTCKSHPSHNDQPSVSSIPQWSSSCQPCRPLFSTSNFPV